MEILRIWYSVPRKVPIRLQPGSAIYVGVQPGIVLLVSSQSARRLADWVFCTLTQKPGRNPPRPDRSPSCTS